MKKYLKYLFIIAIGLMSIACTNTKLNNKNVNIVVTIFPIYDWVKNITKDVSDIEVTLLVDKGSDLHNYQPAVKDIMKISTCDLFIYVGGESDDWVNDAIKNTKNKNMISINLLEELGDKAKAEEVVEGMEIESIEEEDEEIEYDEHVWLSIKNAVFYTELITNSISSIDKENKETYLKNKNEYISELNALDNEYKNAVESKIKDTILFGDRFPFRYLVSDYNLKYYAAFLGCSAETEASFETITFLSSKVDELGLNVILKIDSSDSRIANTIKSNTRTKDQQILEMNSLQSLTLDDYKNGVTYLSVMNNNLSVLKEALK